MNRAIVGTVVIAQTTVLAALRNRLLAIAVLFGVALVAISIAAASISIGERARLIIDVGLAATSGLGSVIAVALTISTFAGEIQRRTAYPLLARPISRGVFVIGKHLGVWLCMIAVVSIMHLSTAGTVTLYGSRLGVAFWSSLPLVWCEMGLVIAIALMFSTFATAPLAATYSAGTLIAGALSGELRDIARRAQIEGDGLGAGMLQGFYYFLPDLQKLSLRIQAANDLPIPPGRVLAGAAYGLCYAIVILALAVILFERRARL